MLASVRIIAGPDGLSVNPEEAAATLYVLYSPQVADMLMGDYGWPPERYERWLARMILEGVIRPRTSPLTDASWRSPTLSPGFDLAALPRIFLLRYPRTVTKFISTSPTPAGDQLPGPRRPLHVDESDLDAEAPLRRSGFSWVSSRWPFLEWQRQGALFGIEAIVVTAGDAVAFALALLRCWIPADLKRAPADRLRLTIGLRNKDGCWVVTHAHHSSPLE